MAQCVVETDGDFGRCFVGNGSVSIATNNRFISDEVDKSGGEFRACGRGCHNVEDKYEKSRSNH